MSGSWNYRSNLQHILSLNQIEEDTFQNAQRLFIPPSAVGVFGGTMIAQSLYAALKTTPQKFVPHSLHAYFLSKGIVGYPITYKVVSLRNGRSFSAREVKAYQQDTLILTVLVSFTSKKAIPESEFYYEPLPVDTPTLADSLPGEEALYNAAVESGAIKQIPKGALDLFINRFKKGPIEYKFPASYWKSGESPTTKKPYEVAADIYFRVRDKIVEDPRFQYVAIAYLSDCLFLNSLPIFYNRSMFLPSFSVSLDHTIHFYDPGESNQWLHNHIKSPVSKDARPLLRSSMYNSDGKLAATILQEGYVINQVQKYRPRKSTAKL